MTTATETTISIKGTEYHATVRNDGTEVVLEREDGTAYAVSATPERLTCTCPDWTYRHAPLPYSDGCKHIKGVVAAGLLAAAV